jgi:hypothetical protein
MELNRWVSAAQAQGTAVSSTTWVSDVACEAEEPRGRGRGGGGQGRGGRQVRSVCPSRVAIECSHAQLHVTAAHRDAQQGLDDEGREECEPAWVGWAQKKCRPGG